jgi:hypothetical protein
VRGRGRRAAAIGECGFNGFRYDVKNEGGEGESVRRCLMRGIEEVRMVLRFLYCGAWEGVPWQSAVWWCRPGQWQLRRPRWETSWEQSCGPQVLVVRTLWWASEEKSGKWDEWAIKATGPKLVWATMRNRQCFQILIQRNEIQI